MGISPLPRGGGGGNPFENPTTNLPIIAAGGSHTLAIIDGELWSWGSNSYGRLGVGDGITQLVPMVVGDQTNWVNVAAGRGHSLAINSLGELWSWGDNGGGQLGLGDYGTGVSRYTPNRVGTATNWVKISAGNYHSLAINSLGELFSWGSNHTGQLGYGTLVQRSTLPVRVGNMANWVNVFAGESYSFSINSDGELWAWGLNNFGQLGLGDTDNRNAPQKVGDETNWLSVSGGYNHLLAISQLGELWAWGENYFGQLGLGYTYSELDYVTTPTRIDTDAKWVSIAAGNGGGNSHALNDLGELFSWGNNSSGQLGIGDSGSDRNIPTRVGTETNWVSISAGMNHCISVDELGELWIW